MGSRTVLHDHRAPCARWCDRRHIITTANGVGPIEVGARHRKGSKPLPVRLPPGSLVGNVSYPSGLPRKLCRRSTVGHCDDPGTRSVAWMIVVVLVGLLGVTLAAGAASWWTEYSGVSRDEEVRKVVNRLRNWL